MGTFARTASLLLAWIGLVGVAQTAIAQSDIDDLGVASFLVASRDLLDPNFSHTVVLVLDTSGSMNQSMRFLQEAVLNFVYKLEEVDTAMVVSFNDSVKGSAEFTGDLPAELLEEAEAFFGLSGEFPVARAPDGAAAPTGAPARATARPTARPTPKQRVTIPLAAEGLTPPPEAAGNAGAANSVIVIRVLSPSATPRAAPLPSSLSPSLLRDHIRRSQSPTKLRRPMRPLSSADRAGAEAADAVAAPSAGPASATWSLRGFEPDPGAGPDSETRLNFARPAGQPMRTVPST